MSNDTKKDLFKDLPKPVYTHLTEYYLYQDGLSWGRTKLLVSIEAGTLATAFSMRELAILVLIFGVALIFIIWRLIEIDWKIRDQNINMLDIVHIPLNIRMTKKPPTYLWSGSKLLRTAFIILILLNIILSIMFYLKIL